MPETTLHQPKDYKALMLSSTFTDLQEHRERAIQAIHKLGYMARAMEHSGAQAEADVIDTSLAMVRDAAAYIGVISFEYGQTPFDAKRNPNRLSVTELEFNEAMGLGRPIVLFIMGDDHPVKKAYIESDPEKLDKLNEFRERAKRMRNDSEVYRVHEVFDSLEQFSIAAATAIGNLVRYLERSASPEQRGAGQTLPRTISNIPITVPRHFLGRDRDLAAIDEVLNHSGRPLRIAALVGLGGIGKTTLAAAYAERHRREYRATWWIRADAESTVRADLVSLGAQLGWFAAGDHEQRALEIVMERLRSGSERLLLIYDNADQSWISKYLTTGVATSSIATSRSANFGSLVEHYSIDTWSTEIGADYLIKSTGREDERDTAVELSAALGGLPIAYVQVVDSCMRHGISLAEYSKRFRAGLDLPDEGARRSAPVVDFFLSYSSKNESIARRINATLVREGYSVSAQFDDFPAGSNFVEEMKRGLKARRIIALLSPAYEASQHCQAEWNSAYASDPDGSKRRLVPLLIEPTELNFLARQIVYANLIGLSGDAFDLRVLEAVRGTLPTTPPIENLQSPIRHGWTSEGKLAVQSSALSGSKSSGSPDGLTKQLATAKKLAERLAKQSSSPQFNYSQQYSGQFLAYLEDLPTLDNPGNIFLCDASARTLREMFAAEADILSVAFAAQLKTFLECHLGLRAYYPELAEFYAAVRDGVLSAPLPIDAVERVRAAIEEHTPDQFDPSVGKELEKEESSAPAVLAEHEAPRLDSSTPQPPPDPIASVDRAQSRDQLIARSLNGLWSTFLKGKDIVPNIEGWRRAYESLEPAIGPVLNYLRHSLGG